MNKSKTIMCMIITFGIIIGIYIMIKSISFFSIIVPQLSQTKENKYKVPKMSSDYDVIQIIEENKGKDMMELYKIGLKLSGQGKYKEAYNIFKLATQSESNLKYPLDVSVLALLNIGMGECYHMILNTEQACYFTDEALNKMPKDAFEYDLYYAYYTGAISYVDNEIFGGFNESKKTLELLKNVLNLKTTFAEKQQYYHDARKETYLDIIQLYSFSPSVYSRELAINYYQEYFKFEPSDVYKNYGLAICYLELGNLLKAEECREVLRKNNVDKIDDYALNAYYNVVSGDMKKAKTYLDKLKHIAVSYNAKSKYFYISTIYYENMGDKEKAKEYLTKFVELSNSEVYTYQVIEFEKSLDINFDYIREKLAKERDANYSIVLDVDGK